MANNPTKKEQFLLKNGRKQETIDFCKKCGITQEHIVWFVDRVEKDKFDINQVDSTKLIKKVFKSILRDNKLKEIGNLIKLIEYVDRFFEDDENVKSRILHSFDDKFHIINLTPKELNMEGQDMRNCVGDKDSEVKNKEYAILALRDEKEKTVCHFQVERNGSLSQHYGKANSTVKSKYWKYIIEFFKKYEDVNFVNEINKSQTSIKYTVNIKEREYNSLPIVESFLPTSYVVPLFRENDKQIISVKFLKDFVNTNDFNESIENSNIEEVKNYLDKYKEYLNKSIDDLYNMVKESSENYLVLSDEIIKKIFGKVYMKPNEKNISIISNQDKMILSYDEYNDYLEDYPIPVREMEMPREFVAEGRMLRGRVELPANPFTRVAIEDEIEKCEELSIEECYPTRSSIEECNSTESYDENNELRANMVGYSFNMNHFPEIEQEIIDLAKKNVE
jgi:hypothetical protein